MNQPPSTLTRVGVVLIVTVIAALIVWSAPPARAAIPGVTASIAGPNPNPIPTGSTASLSSQFATSSDIGLATVSLQLQSDPTFELRLDAANTSPGLTNCSESTTQISCDWNGVAADGTQTLAVFVDVDPGASPFSFANVVAVVAASADTDTYANQGFSVAAPSGSTSLSGSIITEGGAPVPNACLFVLSSPLFVFPVIADSAGNWSITGLPDNYTFVVAVVPPFDDGNGPCVSGNGPPPIPGPGELQPVFIDDTWIDLADPMLTGGQGDPYVFAVNAGARIFDASASGLQTCLTTAPANVVPRPPCVAAVTTTSTTVAGTLPFTGPATGMLLPFAILTTVTGGLLLLVLWRTRRPDEG